MLLGHFRLKVRVDHLIGMGRDRHAAREPCGSCSDLVRREWRGMCRQHGQNALIEAALHSLSRLLYEATCGNVN